MGLRRISEFGIRFSESRLARGRCYLCLILLVFVFPGHLVAEETDAPPKAPFDYVWAKAYHVLPGTHSDSGYFSLVEGIDGKMYIGTTQYGVNSHLVEFDPKTEEQRSVLNTHEVCGLGTTTHNSAQSKIHSRNFVGPSGKVYFGSMHGGAKEEDKSVYPGGYAMTYDPKTEESECLGMPVPGESIIDVVADEKRGIIYAVSIGSSRAWLRYDVASREYTTIGPQAIHFTTTLVDSRGCASIVTKDFQLAQYNPETGKVTERDIVVDGEKLEPKSLTKPPQPEPVPIWDIAKDGRTAYLILMSDPTLYAIDLLSEGNAVKAVSHGKMIEGEGHDSRSALDIGPDGSVYAAIRVDNDTGFGGHYLHHICRFDPSKGKMEDLGVLAVKNQNYYFDSTGADPKTHKRRNGRIYYGYHTLPDGTLTPLYSHMALIAGQDGSIYVTILYPFALLKIDPIPG